MKKFDVIVNPEPKIITMFECEVCKKQSEYSPSIEHCELRHKQEICKHSRRYYKFNRLVKPEDDWRLPDEIYDLIIVEFCADCQTDFGEKFDLKDFENNQSLMHKIVEDIQDVIDCELTNDY